MTNPPSIRYNIKQSIFVHYEMRGRIFKKEEIFANLRKILQQGEERALLT